MGDEDSKDLLEGNDKPSCSICFEDFRNNVLVYELPKCHHNFHIRCLDEWIKIKPLCPNCR